MNLQNLPTPHTRTAPCCGPYTNKDAEAPAPVHKPGEGLQSVLLSVAGMHCGACADRIRSALMKKEGVLSAQVVFAGSAAKVRFDPARADIRSILAMVAAGGYEAWPNGVKPPAEAAAPHTKIGAKPIVLGLAASLGILAFYLGLLTLTSGWYSAKAQFGDYRWWLLSLAAGMGLQVGLFVHLRAFIADARIKGATSSVAASGGVTTLGMALCCSHYLAAFLPAVGLPFLATAVAGLAAY